MIIGIDEVGTGAIAGPVWIVASGFHRKLSFDERIRDSKRLRPSVRKDLESIIMENADYLDFADVSSYEISQYGMGAAYTLAIRQLIKRAASTGCTVIVDGAREFAGRNVFSYPKADANYWQVSCASILGKVWRDEYMVKLDQEIPGYGFAKHKGYGTAEHIQALEEKGPSPEHRMSYKMFHPPKVK